MCQRREQSCEASRLWHSHAEHSWLYQLVSNVESPIVRFSNSVSLCPKDSSKDAYYLIPLTNPTSACWYSIQPIGRNTLAQTVYRLCSSAGIQGFKTNHYLWVTNATTLYASGADEQIVMERTGHRSQTYNWRTAGSSQTPWIRPKYHARRL